MYQNKQYRQAKKSRGWIAAVAVFVIFIAVVIGGFFVVQHRNKRTDTTKTPTEQEASFDKSQFSLTDPASPWLVVNKKRPLNPKQYEPSSLRLPNMSVESSAMEVNDETATALEDLNTAAKNEGIDLVVASAYRSYDNQVATYNSVVDGYGQAEADRISARPGYSEHQTGWAVDLGAANDSACRIESCFADTPEGKWLAANAHKYGFIIRYPEGKESVTGYTYEPWHLRYVGKALSEEMHKQNVQTLEEFFNLPAAPNY